jgi:hypothetical protein
MSVHEELSGYGRQYLQNDSYGSAAFFFYRSIQEYAPNNNAWSGLVLSMILMRREGDAQTLLARFGFQPGLDYDRDMLTFAMMLWQHNPLALAQWLRAVVQMNGIAAEDKQKLTQMAGDMEKAYQDYVNPFGEGSEQAKAMLSLQDVASRASEVDWLYGQPIDHVYEVMKPWLQDEEMVLAGVRLLCMLPDPRSEKLLRRVCRSEETESKVKTHALLGLRWLGIRGNAKIHKFSESFTINLNDPEPELTVSVPKIFKPALDLMKLWLAKEQAVITTQEYAEYACGDDIQLSEAISEKLSASEFPPNWQEVVHALIRAAYDKYYPLVPTVAGLRDWSAAFLILIHDYVTGTGQAWTYGDPEHTETAEQHKNWLLSGTPDFYQSLSGAKHT